MANSPRPGARTWSLLGDVRRKLSPYEAVTSRFRYTFRREPAPFELDRGAPLNQWCPAYREGSAFPVPDWEGFRDPYRLTYKDYVTLQHEWKVHTDLLVDESLVELARGNDDVSLADLCTEFRHDSRRSRDWTRALVRYALEQRPDLAELLRDWTDTRRPDTQQATAALVALFAQAPVLVLPEGVHTAVSEELTSLHTDSGLRPPAWHRHQRTRPGTRPGTRPKPRTGTILRTPLRTSNKRTTSRHLFTFSKDGHGHLGHPVDPQQGGVHAPQTPDGKGVARFRSIRRL